ncbi:hypothetical protein BD410DRAFT_717811, partial [Rickenella mellea]
IDALLEWKLHRNEYLDEHIRLDGLGDSSALLCRSCGQEGLCRCLDCFNGAILCDGCMSAKHKHNPLHRIEASISPWTGDYFQKSSLHAIGYVLHLGHNGLPCTHASPASEPMTIIDTSGIHTIQVMFCGCPSLCLSRRTQLLRVRWWPATIDRPQTVTTFACLDTFLQLSLQSKLNMYDFYLAIVHLTDNTGTRNLKVTWYPFHACSVDLSYNCQERYKEFSRCVHEIRHILSAKRSARGHDPDGINQTKPGECAVECPACPHPDRNLPDGWEDTPERDRFKYALYLAMDANFRLKSKERGIRDSPLGDGWAYFVPTVPFKEHLANYVDQPEMNTCESKLRAVDHANVRGDQRLLVNGVGGVNCSRHALNRQTGFGDLQRGEKYSNMDYFVLSTLHDVKVKTLYLSYDIACQWFVNLPKRIEEYPLRLQIRADLVVIVAVPKLHLVGHGPKCQSIYSLNFIPGSARTCGESIEQIWSGQNAVAMSTREMSPGNRQDTLDDHLGAWNFRKVVGLGKQLLALLREAVVMEKDHGQLLIELSESLESDVVEKWRVMVEKWNADHSQPDPYSQPASENGTFAEVRLELARQESVDTAAGVVSAHETSASTFLSTGLDLEEQQRVLRATIASSSSRSAVQAAENQQKRHALKHRIDHWRGIQAVYMPGVSSTLHDRNPSLDERTEAGNAELSPLILPSALQVSDRIASSLPGLAEKERRLRLAQADDCLQQIRRLLRIKSNLWQYKLTNVSGQRASTRARSIIDRFGQKVQRHADRYRAARTALLALDPTGDWQTRLHVLNTGDIRGLGRDDDTNNGTGRKKGMPTRESEGRRGVSWIWIRKVGHVNHMVFTYVSDVFRTSAMRVEWAKSWARAERWREEVILVTEEMRRTLAFLEWRAKWWESQVDSRMETVDVKSGLRAYAMKQAAVQRDLAKRFARLWIPFLRKNGLAPTLCEEWLPVVPLPLSPTVTLVTSTAPPTAAASSSPLAADDLSLPARHHGLSLRELFDAEDEADGDIDSDGTCSDDDGIFE